MSYTIGFAPKNTNKVSTVEEADARAALETAELLQRSDEIISYIKTPTGYEIGVGELQMLADRERQNSDHGRRSDGPDQIGP